MNEPRATGHEPRAAALALAMALFTASAMAQVINDPTRPPSGFVSGDAEGAGAPEGGGIVLQSVIISPTFKAAIINGSMVKLGEKYGDAVLVKVAENEVVLKSGDESQVLKLHPGVDKREVVPFAAKSAPRKGKPRSGAADSTAPVGPATR